MRKQKFYNILMYSHDTYGLGHIRRTMALASQFRNSETNVLILTGSPIAGRFSLPDQIDFVRIPGMIKKTNEEYLPLSIKINPGHALNIRKHIISATVKSFHPQLVIVDKEPLGLRKEIEPTLKWLQKNSPRTKTVLGLRDIMDDAGTVIESWQDKGIYKALDKYYSEIWVYGIQDFYNPIQEYQIPEQIAQKMCFTGYIPRQVRSRKEGKRERARHKIGEDEKLILVTTGGGGDGYPVMDAYLSMLERMGHDNPYRSVLITGPFMPKAQRVKILKRARKVNALVFHFYRQMEKIIAASDLVISMGGYNTLCELMSQKKVSLLIPRETPRMEQTLRAQCFKDRNLLDYIPWRELSAQRFQDHIANMLQQKDSYLENMSKFKMTGFDVIQQRIQTFRK
jgi:predicted glycosyltransferase